MIKFGLKLLIFVTEAAKEWIAPTLYGFVESTWTGQTSFMKVLFIYLSVYLLNIFKMGITSAKLFYKWLIHTMYNKIQ